MLAVYLLVVFVNFCSSDVSPIDCYSTSTCVDARVKDCLKMGLAFVKRDNVYFCCDSCANIEDVTNVEGCIPKKICTKPCRRHRKCRCDEALVPKGPCHCCDTCTKRTDLTGSSYEIVCAKIMS